MALARNDLLHLGDIPGAVLAAVDQPVLRAVAPLERGEPLPGVLRGQLFRAVVHLGERESARMGEGRGEGSIVNGQWLAQLLGYTTVLR